MKRLKALAMYLPQFYRIPENDYWWGEGYTDWVAVKEATPLFEGHYQPRIPLNGNYYDLSDVNSIREQVTLAKKYNVDGFCIYHYYFENGKKVLEKPAELLLENRDIDIEYCFCWANESWAKSWAKITNTNTWTKKYEKKDESKNAILLNQKYGDLEEWRRHFDYLLPFFKDDRYIKKDNKPVFTVYRPEDIPMYKEMFLCFNEWCKEEGFSGLYSIGANVTHSIEGMSGAVYIHIKNDVFGVPNDIEVKNGVRTRKYDEVWNRMLSLPCAENSKTYFGAFVDRDETPRHGAQGLCLTGGCPQKFEENLFKLAVKNIYYNNEFLFIDAWNEWGEGNYLEPDEKNGYGYLEAISHVMSKVNSNCFDSEGEWQKLHLKEINYRNSDDFQKTIIMYRSYYMLYDRWLKLYEQEKSFSDYFYEKHINTILLYGYTSMADHLIYSLKNSNVRVLGYIDRRDGFKNDKFTVYNLEKSFPQCDAIIVTPFYDFYKIKESLEQKTDATILSIEDVILGVEEIGN